MTQPANRLTTPSVIITLGCLIAMIAFGVRSTVGLFTGPMTEAYGWSREVYGFAFALQNLIWGAAQPVAGAIADRLGAVRVVVIGTLVYAAGVVMMALGGTVLFLNLGGGILMGLGIAATSFSIIMPVFSRIVPPEKRSWAFGIVTAASSLGQFIFAPLGQIFIANYGWQTALLLLAAFLALMIPMVLPFKSIGSAGDAHADEPHQPISSVLSHAFGHSSYLLLLAGFFVCGFHIAFIVVHFPPFLADSAVGKELAGWAIGIIGLFNVIGAYASGIFGGKYSKRYGLSFIYLTRSVAIAAFIFLPITSVSVIIFSAVMGLLWLSTIPLTIGLVMVMFGTRNMAMLYGFVFFSHQVGSFLGVWLGGRFYDQYGNYDLIWYISIALGIAAALVHWPIRERPAPQIAAARAV